MEYRIKTNKTKMYGLVKSHFDGVPTIKKTKFFKVPNRRVYYLEWIGPNNTESEAVLSACFGVPRISFYESRNGSMNLENIRYINVDELIKSGMVDEVSV